MLAVHKYMTNWIEIRAIATRTLDDDDSNYDDDDEAQVTDLLARRANFVKIARWVFLL